MKIISQVKDARDFLNRGKIIAYPTEAVYGLGCCPFNQQAVENLINLKQRAVSKGFILLIADWSQLDFLIDPVPDNLLNNVRNTWPGPVTWVFPKSQRIPSWLSGDHPGIAVRMSALLLLNQLCSEGPVISTSANRTGQNPVVDRVGLCAEFPHGIDALLNGELGGASQVSRMYDVLTGKRLR